jgi:hypothetical protein
MKKYICLTLLICMGTSTFAQEIIINGVSKNRPLTWDDFKGPPDQSSYYYANTFWNITYNINGISFKGDTATINRFSVILKLDEYFCWVKPDKQTDILLKHEQGHFDLGLICQQEIITQLNNTVFFKADFQKQLPNIFSSILEKYRLLGIKYDEETDHSNNQAAQDIWNKFIADTLK